MASPRNSSLRIPSLDGLRAISILLVVISHLLGPERMERTGDLGLLGVRVFFVISGYLITRLLLEEARATGAISLPAFYARRVLRIFPAYYLYLAIVAIAAALGLATLHAHDLLFAFTYTSNYHHERAWIVNHAWSLAVEEQFYLLWPLTMILVRPSRAWIAATIMFVAPPILRIIVWRTEPSWAANLGEAFPTVADAIAAGCLLATLADRLAAWPAYQRFLRSPLFWILPPLAAVANAQTDHPLIDFAVAQSTIYLAIAISIDRFVHIRSEAVDSVLNHRAAIFIGTLSYSIYLWQQPFLDNRGVDSIVTTLPVNLLCAAACAYLSYRLVEQPLLGLRGRLVRK
jgi:peptidoglycan/LPS O-acetylase OafA/YrhL